MYAKFCFAKFMKAYRLSCGLMTATSIDGVVKMPLQASIFTTSKMNSRASKMCTNYMTI